jgi:SpoVK/Ycf46/Vps4 family AAA+-type ATPase
VLESLGIDDPVAMDDLATLRLPPEQLPAIAVTARSRASAEGVAVAVRHVRRAALAVGASRLDAQAQRVAPRATFDDLVLPADMLAELRRLPGRYRTRDIVGGQWQIGHRTGGGRGITCLFAGPSGTGKTLAAEAVAHALGVELFVIDLSQIVDKYIGETEKNLDRVFSEAEGVNGVLLFDEADALFGKRTDVRSSHDRHANVEVAYLLQRMERYDGVAVLTTNLRGNIDEAFSRRLDIICAFAEPDEAARLLLWERHLPPTLPRAADIDLAVLARHFAISGGIIRNAAVTAAHEAADAGSAVTQRMLLAAVRREYAKLGRLFPDTAAGLLDDLSRDR